MGRPRKTDKTNNNTNEQQKTSGQPESELDHSENECTKVEKIEKKQKIDDPDLPKKSLFRVDEVASYLDVSDRAIRRWIQHGILEADRLNETGPYRIKRDSILACRVRFNPK